MPAVERGRASLAVRLLGIGLLLVAWACHPGARTPAVLRGPYLQGVGQDRAVVGLRLQSACVAQVRYGEGGALTSTAVSSGAGTQHFIELKGLRSGTAYSFTIDACGSWTRKGGSVRSAPDATARTVHFAAMGDMGSGSPEELAVGRSIAGAHPDFWLTLGDNAYTNGTDEEFGTHFFSPLEDLLRTSPVFPSLGNHEYRSPRAQPYLEAFELPRNNPAHSERYYSFDWGPVHAVALDSTCALGLGSGTGTGCTLEEQKTWLAADLAASKAPWKIVFFHHPPWSSGSHGSSILLRALGPVFEEFGVDLVLSGHDHDYERTRPLRGDKVVDVGTPGAVTYVVVGTGGAVTYPWPSIPPAWSAYRNNVEHGHLDVRIDGDSLVGEFVTPDGRVVDRFTTSHQ